MWDKWDERGSLKSTLPWDGQIRGVNPMRRKIAPLQVGRNRRCGKPQGFPATAGTDGHGG